MSELDAHQTICLVIGTLSGVCLTLFFIAMNPVFAVMNILMITKVVFGMKRYYDLKSCKENGRELVLKALFRFF